MPTISIQNPVLAGIADSKYLGAPNSLYKIVGFDLISEPGIMKVQQALKEDSGGIIDELCSAIIPASDNNVYFFSMESCTVWVKNDDGYSKITETNAYHGFLAAVEFDGYMYFTVDNKLLRVSDDELGFGLGDWFGYESVEEVGTLEFEDYHPMFVLNEKLYIGNGHKLASVDTNGDFDPFEKRLNSKYTISALGNIGTNLVIGAVDGSNSESDGKIVNWNTWSTGWSDDRRCPERGVYCFIPTGSYSLASCGLQGKLYAYDGVNLKILKRIPGDYDISDESRIYDAAAINDGGISRFGLSDISGSAADCGIYGFGGPSASYNPILTLDYLISTGNYSKVEIGSIAKKGAILYVSWRDSSGVAPVCGIDVIDTSNKFDGAYFDSRLINLERDVAKDFNAEVYYRTLPTGCDIELYTSINGAAYAQIDTVNDTDNLVIKAKDLVANANTIQFRVVCRTTGNYAPEIEGAKISY